MEDEKIAEFAREIFGQMVDEGDPQLADPDGFTLGESDARCIGGIPANMEHSMFQHHDRDAVMVRDKIVELMHARLDRIEAC